jgi:uncharacterized integral membrane protein
MNETRTYRDTDERSANGVGHPGIGSGHDGARIFRVVALVALIVAIVVVAMDNRDDVRLGYVFGDAQAPVWIAVVASAVAGALIGWLIKHRPRRA